jgi:exosortase/archaeosortase
MSGTALQMRGGTMEIISECSAIYVAILFTAAVLAFPTTWRARGRGLAFGLPCIAVLNLLRLVSLGLVMQYRAACCRSSTNTCGKSCSCSSSPHSTCCGSRGTVPREGARQAA